MTESCVQEIELHNSELNSFIREVESKHGDIFTLSELYARGQKLGNEIILGVVDTAFPVIKKRDRQLLVMRLCEVTINCHRGNVFNVYAFNKFATSLADAHLQKGDFAAFCSACIRENSQYRTEKGCHHLEAHIGIPDHPSAKIFFARKSHVTNVVASKHQRSSKNCSSLNVTVERNEMPVTFSREPTPHTVVRGSSPCSTEMSFNSTRTSSVQHICNTVLPSILPRTSPSRVPQTQHACDNTPLALQSPQDKYIYTKLSELVKPYKRVNIYGVIHSIAKEPTQHCKHAVVWLKDETCLPRHEFRVHIFFSRETDFPKLEHGYILRLHRLKTELFEGMIDGRVFRATDIVTFPPEGQGMADAFSTSKCFTFCDTDARRLTELRTWIAALNQQKSLPAVPSSSLPAVPSSSLPAVPSSSLPVVPSSSLPAVPSSSLPAVPSSSLPAVPSSSLRAVPSSSLPVTSDTALLSPVLSSEPTKSQLCEIKKEGNYVLHCKVVGIDIPFDEMHIFTITDGTLFIYCFHLDEDERHATERVRVVILDPSPEVKKIKKGALVELTNVTVQVTVPPEPSECNWPYLSFKMYGNNCSVKILKGFEPEATKLKRRLQDARLNKQLRPPDFVDQLITELTSEFPRQSNSGNHTHVVDTVTHPSVQNDCKQSETVTDFFTGNNHPVQQYLVSSGGEQNHQSEEEQCSPSLMLHAEEEECNHQALQQSVAEQAVMNEQVHLREQLILTGNVKQKRGNADSAVLPDKQQKISARSVLNENCVQEMAEEVIETYAEFSAGVPSGSNAQFCSSTHPLGNQNTDPVLNMECLGDPKISEVESEASEVVHASDDSLDSPGKFSALTQVHLRNIGLSDKHEAETLVFMDVSSDASPADSDSQVSVSRKVQKSCVLVECKGDYKCTEEGDINPSGAIHECTDKDEDMECQSADLHSGSAGCKEKFASGIATSVQGIAIDISNIKRKRMQSGEQHVYLLKAWVKDIEPPINNGSKMNIISGYCNRCNSAQSYEALKKREKNQMLCQYCFQKGLEIPVALGYLLRLHLIDEHNDELIVTVTAHHGVELLGCTVNAYLYDSMANKRVVKILTDLIAKNKNVPPENRGPILKLLVTPIHTSVGTEYMIHSTYLYNMYSEEQRNC